MLIRLQGNTDGSARSLPIDHDRFKALCGDGDGCSLTLGTERLRVYLDADNDPDTAPSEFALDAPYNGGPCKFFFHSPSGSWSLESSCVVWRGELEVEPDLLTSDAGAFKPYAPSNAFGFDNSDFGGRDRLDGSPLPVLAYAYACYLSESPANLEMPGFLSDNDDGFHLIMAGVDWKDYPTDRFPASDPERACILIVED
jgi:hypothetical protein